MRQQEAFQKQSLLLRLEEAGLETKTLTQKSLEVFRTAVLGPVCVLEMPNCLLLPREKVLHLQARGGIAAGVRAEAGCDLKPPISDSVVPGTQARPVPKALLPSALLLKTSTAEGQHETSHGALRRGRSTHLTLDSKGQHSV